MGNRVRDNVVSARICELADLAKRSSCRLESTRGEAQSFTSRHPCCRPCRCRTPPAAAAGRWATARCRAAAPPEPPFPLTRSSLRAPATQIVTAFHAAHQLHGQLAASSSPTRSHLSHVLYLLRSSRSRTVPDSSRRLRLAATNVSNDHARQPQQGSPAMQPARTVGAGGTIAAAVEAALSAPGTAP